MSHNWNRIAQFSLIGGACSLALWMGSSNAEESVLVTKPAAPEAEIQGPELPAPSNPNQSAPNANATSNTDVFAPPVSETTKEPLPTPPQSTPQQAPTSSTARRPFMRPAEPRSPATGRLVVGAEPIPTPAGEVQFVEESPVQPMSPLAGIEVRPTPPIDYDTDHDARKMYRASGKVNVVMLTKDPSSGCAYEIPMCIPACCVGEPRVSGGRGLLGRGVVEYCWPCGFRAIVKFRHVLGDIRVDYEGD